jgi:hypothetical protein
MKYLTKAPLNVIKGFLSHNELFSFNGIVDLIKSYYDRRRKEYEQRQQRYPQQFEHFFFNRLTKDQLKALEKAFPKIKNQKEYFGQYKNHLFLLINFN